MHPLHTHTHAPPPHTHTQMNRNAVHLLESDFEDFKDEYLEDGDTHG